MSKPKIINRISVVSTVEHLDGNNNPNTTAICITELPNKYGVEVLIQNSEFDELDISFTLSWDAMDKLMKSYKLIKQ